MEIDWEGQLAFCPLSSGIQKKYYILTTIFVKFTIIVDGIEPMEFAFPEEDLAISRYNVMTCKTTISLMFEQKKNVFYPK